MQGKKEIIIVAGPNGAGKTSFAREYLSKDGQDLLFLNADLIAAGMNPTAPQAADIRAGRLMLAMMHEYVRQERNFILEVTLSGRRFARVIPQWQAMGYWVRLFYLRLPSPEMAVARVKLRVMERGHDVPEPVIRRRFHSSWYNFQTIYRDLVDEWDLYDNTGRTPLRIAGGRKP